MSMNPDTAARVARLLETLRRETQRLGPLDDSALEYSPAGAPVAGEAPDDRETEE